MRWPNRLTDVVNGRSIRGRVGSLIDQDRLQKIPSDGRVGVQERGPRSVDHINHVRVLPGDPSAPSQDSK